MGNDLSSVGNKFGLLAGLIGNVSTTTCGLSGKRTVAIHCRGGWSWNNLFVFDGPLEPADRYDGMKLAFGEGTEILKPYREGPLISHEILDVAGYNRLLVAVQNRQRSWDAHRNEWKSRVTNDSVEYHRQGPIWDWAVRQKYGLIKSGAYALPSLLPLPILFAIKSWKEDAGPMFLYLAIFVIFKLYVHLVLHINRHVAYIKISKESTQLAITAHKPPEGQTAIPGSTSESSEKSLWQILRDRPGLTTKAPNGGESIDDVRRGDVRLLDQDNKEYLLVPVIGLQPFIGFDCSQWWFLARRFRGPLLTISWLAEGTLNHSWSVAFAICTFVEAALQDDVARVFLADTSTHSVNWFRMLDDHSYPEEYRPFRQDLPCNLSRSPIYWPWFGPSS